MGKANITCRIDPGRKPPRCEWCMLRAGCKGPVNRAKNAYSISNCPAGYRGGALECRYCRDAHYCRVEREAKKKP